jgi:hypothetical protein
MKMRFAAVIWFSLSLGACVALGRDADDRKATALRFVQSNASQSGQAESGMCSNNFASLPPTNLALIRGATKEQIVVFYGDIAAKIDSSLSLVSTHREPFQPVNMVFIDISFDRTGCRFAAKATHGD